MFVRAICRGCHDETYVTDRLPVRCERCGAPFFTYQTFSPETIARYDKAFLKLLHIADD